MVLITGGALVGGAAEVLTLEAGGAGGATAPKQAPHSDLQPAPQKSKLEPHQKNCEQQGPYWVLPMQMVPLPHMPLVVTRRPVGVAPVDVATVVDGGRTVVVVGGGGGAEVVVGGGGGADVVVGGGGGADVVVGGGGGAEVVVGGGGGADVVGGCGAVRGHPHTPYCVWQPKRGAQWSTVSPQKP